MEVDVEAVEGGRGAEGGAEAGAEAGGRTRKLGGGTVAVRVGGAVVRVSWRSPVWPGPRIQEVL